MKPVSDVHELFRRQRAIRSLGAQKAERTGTLLVEIYTP